MKAAAADAAARGRAWRDSVPLVFSAAEGRDLCDRASRESRAVILGANPLVPAGPSRHSLAVYDSAARELRQVRDGLDALERRGVRALAPGKISRFRALVLERGSALYTAAMHAVSELPEPTSPMERYTPSVLPTLKGAGVVVVVVLAWLVWREARRVVS